MAEQMTRNPAHDGRIGLTHSEIVERKRNCTCADCRVWIEGYDARERRPETEPATVGYGAPEQAEAPKIDKAAREMNSRYTHQTIIDDAPRQGTGPGPARETRDAAADFLDMVMNRINGGLCNCPACRASRDGHGISSTVPPNASMADIVGGAGTSSDNKIIGPARAQLKALGRNARKILDNQSKLTATGHSHQWWTQQTPATRLYQAAGTASEAAFTVATLLTLQRDVREALALHTSHRDMCDQLVKEEIVKSIASGGIPALSEANNHEVVIDNVFGRLRYYGPLHATASLRNRVTFMEHPQRG